MTTLYYSSVLFVDCRFEFFFFYSKRLFFRI